MLEFNEQSDSIVGLNNGYLDSNIHLKYNRKLNMKKKDIKKNAPKATRTR